MKNMNKTDYCYCGCHDIKNGCEPCSLCSINCKLDSEEHIPLEEKEWAKEMEMHFKRPRATGMFGFSTCVCRHCGSIVEEQLAMKHLEFLHNEKFLIVNKLWNQVLKVKGDTPDE